MYAVGALDAYTDLVAATIISKSRYGGMNLLDSFYKIELPIRAILEPYSVNTNWRWRMAARKMMERKNILGLVQIKGLFNPFFRKKHKFFMDLLDVWICHPQAKMRHFGITEDAYASLGAKDQVEAKRRAYDHLDTRFRSIIQRRHDCIHNCDRPKMAPQPLVKGQTVIKVIQDVEFLVNRCDEHINAEFRQFLLDCSCPLSIVSKAGY